MPACVLSIDVEFPGRPVADALATLDEILDLLNEREVSALLFVQGRWAAAHGHRFRDGLTRFTVGLHGNTHVDARRLTREGLRQEASDGGARLREHLGVSPSLYRVPYGFGGDDPAVVSALNESGLQLVGWDYSSRDWDPTLDDGVCVARVDPVVRTGGIVLFHSWVARTPALLRTLFDGAPGAQWSELEIAKLRVQAPQGPRYLLRRPWEQPAGG